MPRVYAPRRVAECHPNIPYAGRGLCRNCYERARGANNSEYGRQRKDWKLRWSFGVTLAQYERLLDRQDGVCAICRRPPKSRRLAVDHDHDTGRIRGLLCWWCNNRVVPKLNTPALLRRAIAYLESDFDGRTL